jgi:hypothetical protein
MCIITNLTKIVEELTAQELAPVSIPVSTENLSDELPKAMEDDDDDLFDEGFVEMMPCDFSGYCAGTNCPNFFKCKGFTK